jgi:thioredoxin 1
MATVSISDDSFKAEVLDSELPVLVDFWAEWCAPCKMIAPMVEDLSNEYDGKFKFTKLNVDDNPNTAAQFGIRGIPTLLIFHNGAPVDQVVGAVPKNVLKGRVDDVLTKVGVA